MKYCVVIPIYKPYDSLTDNERLCLNSVFKEYQLEKICFICSYDFDCSDYKYDNVHIERFDNIYFDDIKGYSLLCTSAAFYERFIDYDYILIHQTDAYSIHNNIEYFMNLDYDYYGAPWKSQGPFHDLCGNGGFSLRKVNKMIEVCKTIKPTVHWEDTWFCLFNRDKLNICPLNIGWEFSWESYFPTNQEQLPMGCHKLWEYNNKLWKKITTNE